ncbi:DUF7504 family protein [Haladaptatus cibarius]|uniref:DUF7504 family protein n=1 Tax=Haladaptatus cibarius TaxID=453847 RepID=UPI000679CE5A|nr:hypothetical protein [Haladaptatus cibarius]
MPFVREGGRNEDDCDFDIALQALKRQGCTLLVTGAVPEYVTAQATQRLLGDPHRDRKRLLVFTDASLKHVERSLPPNVRRSDESIEIIESTGDDRSIPPESQFIGTSDCEVGRLQDELAHAISHFDTVADGLDPAELRVCIDSLESILEANDRPETIRFLRGTSALVRGVRGIQHVHLPVSDESPVVTELSPLFDARIELRKRDTLVAEQRWHVPGHDITTTWSQL